MFLSQGELTSIRKASCCWITPDCTIFTLEKKIDDARQSKSYPSAYIALKLVHLYNKNSPEINWQ